MKKLESTFSNMVIVLVAVAVIVGGILAWCNDVTKEPIKEQDAASLAAGIKSVMGVDDIKVLSSDTVKQTIGGKEYVFVVHKTADATGKSLGAAVESTIGGFGGDLKVLVGFSSDSKVLGYTILQTAETPGLGAKADKWFQKDGKGCIVGKEMDSDKPLTVTKDGGDIDAITASTITSRAFLKAVNQAYAAYAEKNVDTQSGATKVHDAQSGATKRHKASEEQDEDD